MSKTNIYKTQEIKISKLNKDENHKERDVHLYFEKHIETLINARIISAEYYTGKGRIDTLAIDDDNRPVIIEYKKDRADKALLQAMFYRNWLQNNRRQFYLEVKDKFGEATADNIIFNETRVIIVAQKIDSWTIAATSYIDSVELFEYSFYENKGFFQLTYIKERGESNNKKRYFKTKRSWEKDNVIIDSKTGQEADYETALEVITKGGRKETTNLYKYEQISKSLKDIYEKIKEYAIHLDDNIEVFNNKDYWTFKRERKFMEVIFLKGSILIQLALRHKPKEEINYKWKGDKGHWGSLHHHIYISKISEIDIVKKYIKNSFINVQEL